MNNITCSRGFGVLGLGVLIAATVVAPPQWVVLVFDADSDDDWVANKEYGFCSFPDDANVTYVEILTLLVILSQVITCVMSCRLRRVPQDISDSRRVCRTICFHLVVIIVGLFVSLVGLVIGNVSVQAIAFTSVTFLTVYSSLCCLVAPKMYSVGYERFKGHAPGEQFGGQVRVTGLNNGRVPSSEPTVAASTFVEPSRETTFHQEINNTTEASLETHVNTSEGKSLPASTGSVEEGHSPPAESAVVDEETMDTKEVP